MVDITGTNSGNISRPATVTQEQCSQPPMSPPAQLSNDRTTETSFGYKEGHSTPVCTNATQPAKRENTYQPLIPLRVHQKSISTEYQSLRQLPKEKSHDLPPPIPPKPRCD